MATGTPGTNGVWQYGEDDSEATFSALLNKAASTTDTQIGLDRARLTTLEARKLTGLVPVVPSSIANSAGSASFNSTTGLVTFASTPSISMNSIFTSAYTNYRIELNITSTSGAAGGLTFRFRSAGTDKTSNYYLAGLISNAGGTTGGYCANGVAQADLGPLASTADSYTSSIIEISDPAKTIMTKAKFLTSCLNSSQGSFVTGSNLQNQALAFDGITIYGSSGTIMNGTVKVYGWN